MSATISDVLFDGAGSPSEAMSNDLARSGMHLGDLGPAGMIGDAELGAAVATLLEEPVANLAIRGWKHHHRVEVARDRTRLAPGSTEVVELMRHEVKSQQRPTVEVFVDDTRVKVIQLEVDLSLHIDSVTLTVSDGQVSGWSPGATVATCTISAEGVELVKQERTVIDLRNGA